MRNRDRRILDKNLRGCWKAENVSNTIGDEAAQRHYHHGSVTATGCNPLQCQVLGDCDLLGVSAGTNANCGSSWYRVYSSLDGGVVGPGSRAETDGN